MSHPDLQDTPQRIQGIRNRLDDLLITHNDKPETLWRVHTVYQVFNHLSTLSPKEIVSDALSALEELMQGIDAPFAFNEQVTRKDLQETSQRLQNIRERLDTLLVSHEDDPEKLEKVHLICQAVEHLATLGPEEIESETLSGLETLVSPVDISTEEITLYDQGVAHFQRFEFWDHFEDLNRAITCWQSAVDALQEGDDEMHTHLTSLGGALLMRFEQSGSPEDLEAAILKLQQAVDLTPDSHARKAGYLSNLGNALETRFTRFGFSTDLDEAISRCQAAVILTPDGDPGKPGRLNNLGIALQSRFDQYGTLIDLEDAISQTQKAVDLTSDDDPSKPSFLSSLGNALEARFARHGSLTDLEGAISQKRKSIDLTPNGHLSRPGRLNSLGNALEMRFNRHGSLVDLEEAILQQRMAVTLTADVHPSKPSFLVSLGNALRARFDRNGSIADLEDAILQQQKAVDIMPDNHPSKPACLAVLGQALQTRFCRHGTLADLDDAIEKQRKAVETIPDNHISKSACLNSLGSALQTRFDRAGSLADLEEAILQQQKAIELTASDHPDQPCLLIHLGNALKSRFDRSRSLVDLESAILCQRRAVDLTPDGHSDRPGFLNNLGETLQTRFDRYGTLADLEEAIFHYRKAVELTPDDHPKKPDRLQSLGCALQQRFERCDSPADIEDAISQMSKAIDLTPDDPDKATYLGDLGNILETRFGRHGSLADLEDAISHKQKAVDLVPDGHLAKPVLLNNLGNALEERFNQRSSLSDLENAIIQKQRAVDLTPDDHPSRPGFLTNLGRALWARFGRRGMLTDLEDAILQHRKAVDLTPVDHPRKPGYLNNLGTALQHRFERCRSFADLEDAILQMGKAIDLTPEEHPDKPRYINNLGSISERKFYWDGNLLHLEDSVQKRKAAISLMSPDHKDRALCLYNLSRVLKMQFVHFGRKNDLQVALSAAKELAELQIASSRLRLEGALLWAQCCTLGSQSSCQAFENAIHLLPRIAWLGLAIDDQYFLLADAGSTTRAAVEAAIREGNHAKGIEWAEQGRSVVWQNLLGLRTPLDGLQDHYPNLATRLRKLSQQLERATDSQPTPSGSHKTNLVSNQMKMATERDRLIDEVRSKPGFETFMNPKSLEELAPAIGGGTFIFLNLGEAHCDALALRSNANGVPHVLPIPLKHVTPLSTEQLSEKLTSLLRIAGVGGKNSRKLVVEDSAEYQDSVFVEILRTLWLDYVKPVVDALAYSVNLDSPPRLWWCTTGQLAFLPLHAAGLYSMKEAGHKLSDYVVSSYTPTLTTLLDRPLPSLGVPPKLLTVVMSETPMARSLPNTEKEADVVKKIAAQLPVVSLKNEKATKKNVMEELKYSSWAHLTCHGKQIGGKPMESGLLLHDGMLELSEIIQTQLPNAEFAFLSACETAVGDGGVPEESAHLAAGMLFAGYRGVVATMWSIQDNIAPGVAEDFYGYMFRNGQPKREEAAYALHRAIKSLRESGVPFTSWVPFIHVGH